MRNNTTLSVIIGGTRFYLSSNTPAPVRARGVYKPHLTPLAWKAGIGEARESAQAARYWSERLGLRIVARRVK